LSSIAPDVALVCEIDRGMARTENSDRLRDLAERLGCTYAYAVEFVELGLGDLNEQRIHAGASNDQGLHGAAIFSDATLASPFLIRIDARGDWFDGSRHEPRVGGTIALGAYVTVAGVPVMMINVHLESHGDPAERASDMERLLTIIDGYDDHTPILLGGDFNTSTGSHVERWSDRAAWVNRLQGEPDRLTRPQAYEPLFACAARFGYEWRSCNVASVPTQRFPVDDDRPRMKLDWFFTRSLFASDPQIVAALRPDGLPSSDHDALVVAVAA
jgi:endonuclease/exonuclease/phosphatase family metal-dependent hydrolase